MPLPINKLYHVDGSCNFRYCLKNSDTVTILFHRSGWSPGLQAQIRNPTYGRVTNMVQLTEEPNVSPLVYGDIISLYRYSAQKL